LSGRGEGRRYPWQERYWQFVLLSGGSQAIEFQPRGKTHELACL